MIEVLAQADASVDGWLKTVGTGSAALLIAGLWIWMTRQQTQSHKECNQVFADAMKDVSEKHSKSVESFNETVRDQTAKFGETTTTLLREARTECAAREDKLIEVLKEARRQ